MGNAWTSDSQAGYTMFMHMIIPFFLLCFSGGEHQNSCRSCSIVFARCENGEPASGFVVESCVEILFEHWWNVTCS